MQKSLSKQNGAVLLIMAIVVTLAFLTVFIQFKGASRNQSSRQADNAAVLSQAKSFIIAHALKQDPPGALPCPDIENDGIEDSSLTGCQRTLGFLPYRTIQMPEQRDDSASKLWYALEGRLATNTVDIKNSSTTMSLSLDGAPVVAVIISPGVAQESQNRANFNANNYLEGVNADGNLTTYTQTTSDAANDQVVGISAQEFWQPIEKRVSATALTLLSAYKNACGDYPWAATFGQSPYNSVVNSRFGALPLDQAAPTDWGSGCAAALSPITWLRQHWSDSLYFHFCISSSLNCLTLVGDSTGSPSALVITPGPALAGQVRPSLSLTNYFESENADSNNEYRQMNDINLSAGFNDRITIIEN